MHTLDRNIRFGNYMHTSVGQKYWPMDPRPDEVNIMTIAHHLANRCRWNGATRHPTDPNRIFYSVAEHSVYCSYIGPEDEALERLLHDASEAYNGDLIRPLKYSKLFAQPFKQVEEWNEKAIAEAFDLKYPFPPSVKIADEAVTAAEAQQIIEKDPDDEWESGMLHDESFVAPIRIEMWSPIEARQRFLERFEELWIKRTAQTMRNEVTLGLGDMLHVAG